MSLHLACTINSRIIVYSHVFIVIRGKLSVIIGKQHYTLILQLLISAVKIIIRNFLILRYPLVLRHF